MNKFLESKLIEKYNNKAVTRKELHTFYKSFESNLKESTFSWRIHDLKNKNILKPIKRNVYLISSKPIYEPYSDNDTLKIVEYLSNEFQGLKYSIWETNWLNEFSQHLLGNKIIIIEVEKDIIESVYFSLKDFGKYDVFLNPDEKVINYYVSESQSPIVLKKLISRSPLQKQNGFYSPSLEKIIVDIFSDRKLFYFIEGEESIRILENALDKYVIDMTKLMRYAERREKGEMIYKIINEHNKFIEDGSVR